MLRGGQLKVTGQRRAGLRCVWLRRSELGFTDPKGAGQKGAELRGAQPDRRYPGRRCARGC